VAFLSDYGWSLSLHPQITYITYMRTVSIGDCSTVRRTLRSDAMKLDIEA